MDGISRRSSHAAGSFRSGSSRKHPLFPLLAGVYGLWVALLVPLELLRSVYKPAS